MKKIWVLIPFAVAILVIFGAGSVAGRAERLVSTDAGGASVQTPVVAASEGIRAAAKRDGDAGPVAMSPMGRLAHLAATGRLDRALAKARARREAAARGARPMSGGPGGLDDDDSEGPAGGQAETSIAVDSTGMHVVIGFNDFRGFDLNPISLSGFMYSDDGGATFTDGGQLPSPGTDLIGTDKFPWVFGDPEVKYLGGCTFVYFSILLEKIGTAGVAQTMGVHRSTDCGHTWGAGPFEVPPATNPNGAADKEFADRDPDTGRVLLTWTNFSTGVEISASYSDDLATATPPTWAARRVLASGTTDGQGSIPRFAGNGSPNAYVAWSRFPGFYANNVGFVRSTDNGVTWSAPINLTTNFLTSDYIPGNDRVNNNPSLAVDNSPGPYKGYVYVVYGNNNSFDGLNVVFQRSTDGGLTFSAPVLINSRPGNDRAQWFPWVAVDSTTGRISVHYYDQGIAASGDLTETTYLFSDDGGTTWSKPMALSDRPYHAGWGNDTGQPNLGDYNQAVAQGGELFAVWAGTELKGFADGQPSISMTTPDVFFKRAPAVKTSVDLGAVTFTESGGNGFIDPGEQVHLTMPLRNYVTNPLSAAAVTGITATLSTSTPGVSVTGANSTYLDLAPGASAANATDYVLQLSPAFVAGTHIELSLAVTSAQGTNTLLFTQATGTPAPTVLLSENFEGVAPGTLPAGWTASHGAGGNVVRWTTTNTFPLTASNGAFHANANDGPGGGSPARWERLFSPAFTVPAGAEYVTVDMDVAYDTEDDPVLPNLAYDGFFLRVVDLTAGRTLRSVLAEAFEEEFTTGSIQHYPKHFPRNADPAYFEDMSAWAGFSNGYKHVRVKFPGAGGLAGARAQLRFEFTQDGLATCADVRPGHSCGVLVDNLVVRSVVSGQPVEEGDVSLWIGLKNSDDVGTRFDLKTEVFRNGAPFGSAEVDNVPGGSSGFNNAILRALDLIISGTPVFQSGDVLTFKVSVRAGATGHRSGTARLWFNDSQANSHFDLTAGGVTTAYYLLDGFSLGTSPGPGPKKTIDVFVDRLVGGNPFKPFGTWSKTF